MADNTGVRAMARKQGSYSDIIKNKEESYSGNDVSEFLQKKTGDNKISNILSKMNVASASEKETDEVVETEPLEQEEDSVVEQEAPSPEWDNDKKEVVIEPVVEKKEPLLTVRENSNEDDSGIYYSLIFEWKDNGIKANIIYDGMSMFEDYTKTDSSGSKDMTMTDDETGVNFDYSYKNEKSNSKLGFAFSDGNKGIPGTLDVSIVEEGYVRTYIINLRGQTYKGSGSIACVMRGVRFSADSNTFKVTF